MMYVDFEAGNKAYKLRLNTRSIIALEKQLGCNPVNILNVGNEEDLTLPPITSMVMVLHASLQQLNHGITLDEAFNIFDEYLADGNTALNFLNVIMNIYKVSGLLPDVEGAEKN